MGIVYVSIGETEIKRILSKFLGPSKRIPLSCIGLTMTDFLVTEIDINWLISEDDVKDHRGILQGVMIQEAASQGMICYVASMNLFPNHLPAFLGSEHFKLRATVYSGDNLHIKITDIRWRGKVGCASANAFIENSQKRAATIRKMFFTAYSDNNVIQTAEMAT